MTEVLQRSPSHFPSPSSSSIPNDGSHPHSLLNSPAIVSEEEEEEEEEEEDDEERKERDREGDQLSLLALLVAAFRKSLIGCSTTTSEGKISSMEIGWPSNVRHVAHVTFDRFNGFLGLPAEFEPEVPRRAPSASANVFGVSTESMQLSFDSRGNSVPTILLLMQRHLYIQGGLEAEGIFRITAGNSQEEYVRDQLNRGVIPEGVDVHCLAGLIKAWFRELPAGVLDSLSPEQVMQSQTEEECGELVKLLPPTETALLDWAINLMADVAQFEHLNKMNARNVAMVFAPNMTQMTDPLTALMYAVQVMNFLRTLITKTLKEREDCIIEAVALPFNLEPSDDNGHQSSSSQVFEKADNEEDEDKENRDEQAFVEEEPNLESSSQLNQFNLMTGDESLDLVASDGNAVLVEIQPLINHCPCSEVGCLTNGVEERFGGQSSNGNLKKGLKKKKKSEKTGIHLAGGVGEKSRKVGILSRINSRIELAEAWR